MPRSVFQTQVLVMAVCVWPTLGWSQDASTLSYQKSNPSQSDARNLKPGANSFAQGQAKKLIESQGYSDVSTLVNGSDGIWRGTALKDDRKVDVSVDFQGHVAAK